METGFEICGHALHEHMCHWRSTGGCDHPTEGAYAGGGMFCRHLARRIFVSRRDFVLARTQSENEAHQSESPMFRNRLLQSDHPGAPPAFRRISQPGISGIANFPWDVSVSALTDKGVELDGS